MGNFPSYESYTESQKKKRRVIGAIILVIVAGAAYAVLRLIQGL